jgi:hypothetical protein
MKIQIIILVAILGSVILVFDAFFTQMAIAQLSEKEYEKLNKALEKDNLEKAAKICEKSEAQSSFCPIEVN